MPSRKQPAALFDFDGTITRHDSTLPFLLHILRHYPQGLLEVPHVLHRAGEFVLGRVGRAEVKDAAMGIFGRVPEGARRKLIEDYHDSVLVDLYLQGALERIAWHRDRGHRLVLVSASLDLYLTNAARHLGFDELLATRTAMDSRPRVKGANCKGREKVNRLLEEAWFDEIDWPASWAYSDHISDLPMLLLSGHPVATTPTATLRKHATRQGWQIIDWR